MPPAFAESTRTSNCKNQTFAFDSSVRKDGPLVKKIEFAVTSKPSEDHLVLRSRDPDGGSGVGVDRPPLCEVGGCQRGKRLG
jgi:hypothetical protein